MSDNRTSKVFDGGVEGHARYASQAHPALGCQDGRNGVPDTNAKPVAGIKPGPSDTSLDNRFKWLADEAANLGYILTPEPGHPDSPHAPQAVEAVGVDEVERVIVAWADAEELELTIRQVHALARALLAKFKMEGR